MHFYVCNKQNFLALFLILLLPGCATPKKPELVADLQQQQQVFATPAGLEPQVEFWRKVYSQWRLDQVVLHDDRYMQLIYQVIDLPGSADQRYDEQQRAYVRASQQGLEMRLRSLESKLFADQPLDFSEQRLLQLISDTAGRHAVYGAADRMRSQRGIKERFKRGLEISGRYEPWFRQVFREAGLPEDLTFLPHVESSFQLHARSGAGAVGMWQFTRGAARRFMNDHPALDERLDPIASARGAARYLGYAHERLEHWPLSLTSYNHGIRGMQQAKERYGNDFMRIVREYDGKAFKFASRNFYAEFLAAREIALNPQQFFPEGIRYYPPLNWDHVILAYEIPVSALAFRYRTDPEKLRSLNPAWTRAALSGRVALPAGTQVWLPSGTLARVGRSNPSLALSPDTGRERQYE